MKLFILGATGGIGRHLVRLALERGHFVTAYVRSPKKIGEVHERLKVMQGDVFNAGEMAGSMESHDAVLSSFGPNALLSSTLRRDFGRAPGRRDARERCSPLGTRILRTPLEILVLFCRANRPLPGNGSGQLNLDQDPDPCQSRFRKQMKFGARDLWR
jgi:NAD(P)-dependent dehydrogenase (short-subunit alcohol dehydrogenase family)